MPPKRKPIHLKIILDTNVIYIGTSTDLIKTEIQQFIAKYKEVKDLKISWHLPDVVINERRFQMRKIGSGLLPSLAKMEKLLGHNLNITAPILEARIDTLIAEQVSSLGISEIKLNAGKVNWPELIAAACYRLPPFSDNETEKGFRDALALECTKQLLEETPVSPSIARVILVSGDKLLIEAAKRQLTRDNFFTFEMIEEVENLINVVTSQISEEFIARLIPKAALAFFEKDNRDSLYYRENILKMIFEKFPEQTASKPADADTRKNNKTFISKPVFEHKEGQTITFKSVIEIQSEYFTTFVSLPSTQALSGFNTGITGTNTGLSGFLKDPKLGALLHSGGLGAASFHQDLFPTTVTNTETYKVATGQTFFEVVWSATVTTSQLIKNVKVEKINFISDSVSNAG